MLRSSIAGPFEFVTELSNTTEDEIRIDPGSFASVRLKIGADAEIMKIKKESGIAEGYTHYDGLRMAGSGIYTYKLKDILTESAWVNVYQNFNASGYFPMIYLQSDNVGAFCALEWSAGRVIVAASTEEGVAALSVDMNNVSLQQSNFTTRVEADETFIFPTVYIGAYDGESYDDGSNFFKSWFFACKVPDNLRDNPNEPFTQMDMQIGLEASELGVDAIK